MKSSIKAFIDEYLSELIEGNAAIFAGAGLSVPAGYVDWRELIRPLSKELDLDIDLESDLVTVAQFHVNANGYNRHKLHKAVIEALSVDNPPTENHRLLARLPIRVWWTTNYDKLLETALREAGKVVDVKSAVPQLATTRPRRDATIYKMHGDVDRPDEAVATRDDFERYFRDRGAFITALAGDLVSKTFLFLGFSFTDPNLEQVLARVRLTFTSNQRRHFAVFRTRKKAPGETEKAFEHFRNRQALVIEDLKRFNVRVLLVDEYSEITEFLAELVSRYRRRTVFVSGSAANFEPWGQTAVLDFLQQLGQRLVASGTRTATGLGTGVGDAIFTGALREVRRSNGSIEDSLVLRPFPHTGTADDLAALWEDYRQEIVSHAGISLFLFGNRYLEGDVVTAKGVFREFEIAVAQGSAVVPVGATGSASKELADVVLGDPAKFVPSLDEEGINVLRAISAPTEDLISLIEPILHLVRKLQEGTP
ncbi:MAG: hypothetical protein E5X34_26975 [Mesorhizobium sp.]|uniref:SIR2 family protein n=1 Tax=Mesorhizobium sp. TaxID=1871066 RepID=UPI0011F7AB84|nr:SIR2 family protein [Mesorhizobium sp.]TIR15964.1 MAG: hypothetical protein E5X34_26975 [Mesorhizobium sp.]